MDLNCKGLLQNFCQKIKAELPRYNCAQRVQDKHPLFLATVLAMGRNFASEGEFSNKKQAEKSAAYVALRELGILPEEKTKDFEPSAAEGQGSGTQGTSQDGKNSNNTTSKEEHPLLSSSPNGTIVLSPSNSQQPSASSCGSNVSFKNVLQERAQKMGLALPHYETESLGSGFVCTVTFNGQCYKSECFSPNKKHAQQSAACVALNLFSTERSECIESPGGTRNTPVVFENPCAVVKAAGVSYKNLLQEHCQQRGYKPPAYTTVWKGINSFDLPLIKLILTHRFLGIRELSTI